MSQNIKHIVYPVKDLEKAKVLYGKFLQAEPYVDSPYYVGYKVNDVEFGLDPNAEDVVTYIDVTDIKSYLEELMAAGGTVVQEPTNVGGGLLIAKIKDSSGNVVGLRQEAITIPGV